MCYLLISPYVLVLMTVYFRYFLPFDDSPLSPYVYTIPPIPPYTTIHHYTHYTHYTNTIPHYTVGGRGGGKPGLAQGSVTPDDHVSTL